MFNHFIAGYRPHSMIFVHLQYQIQLRTLAIELSYQFAQWLLVHKVGRKEYALHNSSF